MGILGLRKLLKKEAPNCIQEKILEDYRGHKIAIDANIVFFGFMATGLKKLHNQNRPTGHLLGFLQRTAKFLSFDINPIRAEKYGNAEGAVYLGRKSQEAKTRYSECRSLLSLMGVPCLKAHDEGEAQCCYLCGTGQVNAVASQDSDCLAYGAKKVIVNFDADDEVKAEEYDHKVMLDELGLTKESFIDFCILAGCDYCDRIEGMDAEKALELIREFTTIDKVLENIDRKKYQISEEWLTQYKDARVQFTEPQVKEVDDDDLKTKCINEERLMLYLVTEHNFKEKTVDKALTRIKITKQRSKEPGKQKTQSSITQYYPKRSMEKGTGEGESSKRSKP
ncbi:unnamed protein product [Urochloa humidicola]